MLGMLRRRRLCSFLQGSCLHFHFRTVAASFEGFLLVHTRHPVQINSGLRNRSRLLMSSVFLREGHACILELVVAAAVAAWRGRRNRSAVRCPLF